MMVDHRFDLGSVSALSEMSSKSACASLDLQCHLRAFEFGLELES